MKQLKKGLFLLLVTCFLFIPNYAHAIDEGETETPNPTEEPVQSDKKEIKLDKTNIDELWIEQTITLTATTNPENSIVVWSSSNENIATVDDTGKVTAKSLAGEVIITATIKDTDISATCNIKVTRKTGSDATLKQLVIDNGKLDKEFKSDVYEYAVKVDTDIKKLQYRYELSDDKNAKIFHPSNNNNIENGTILEIKVIAEDKTTNHIYKLKIVKDTTDLNLTSLTVNGYPFNETFNSNNLKYTVNIPYEIDTITIEATANNNTTIEGIGTKKLEQDTTKFTITVKDNNSSNSKNYEITAIREKESHIESNESSIISGNNTNNSIDKKIPSTNSNDDNLIKYIIVSFACLVLFIIGGIGIYFYIKTSPRKIKRELKKKNSDELKPLVEVEDNNNSDDIMDLDLLATKEFNTKELQEEIETLDE